MSDETTELLHVGDILFNEPCDERIVVIAANERNVWLRKVQKNDELAMHDGHVWAMLGKKCNVKNMCTQSYAQHVFELDGHVGQTTSEMRGTLTAERVHELIELHSHQYQSPIDEHVWLTEYNWQAIADELNATLGSGECEWLPVESCHTFAGPGWECSNCGHEVGEYEHDFYNCCPICCARVVER